MEQLGLNKPSKKEFLRMKLREKIDRKKGQRMRTANKKIEYKKLNDIKFNLFNECVNLINDVHTTIKTSKKQIPVIKLATKFRSIERFEKIFIQFPKIFTAIIKQDLTMDNINMLKHMLKEREMIKKGQISIDESNYNMGQKLFNDCTNKEEIDKLKKNINNLNN